MVPLRCLQVIIVVAVVIFRETTSFNGVFSVHQQTLSLDLTDKRDEFNTPYLKFADFFFAFTDKRDDFSNLELKFDGVLAQ